MISRGKRRKRSHPYIINRITPLWNDNFDRRPITFGRKLIETCGFLQIGANLSLCFRCRLVFFHLKGFGSNLTKSEGNRSTFWKKALKIDTFMSLKSRKMVGKIPPLAPQPHLHPRIYCLYETPLQNACGFVVIAPLRGGTWTFSVNFFSLR